MEPRRLDEEELDDLPFRAVDIEGDAIRRLR